MDSQSKLDQYVLSSEGMAVMWRGRWLQRRRFIGRRRFIDRDGDRTQAEGDVLDVNEDLVFEKFNDLSEFGRGFGEDEPAASEPTGP